MLDSKTVIRIPHDRHDSRVSVSMKDEGVELRLFFEDASGEGEVLEVLVLPDTHGVSPQAMHRMGARFSLYVRYARAALQWDRENVRTSLATLRSFGKTSRGLTHDHYIRVAELFNALATEGSPYPTKALGEILHTDISNASRWRKEAERRGLIAPR